MVSLCCAVGTYVKTYELSSDAMRLHRAVNSLNAEVTCARYNHNGKIIASCSVDGGICLDVAASGELLSRFFYPAKTMVDRRVNAVQFSSGSRFLASGGSDGCVRVWDLKTQEVSQIYSISASPVTSVTFSGYKDDFIVAGSESGAISVCDVQSAETVGFLSVDPKFPVASVTSVVGSQHPYAKQIVGSTYADGSVRVWDLQTGTLSVEFANQHTDAASCLAISPVSKVLLASGGLDRRVLFFDTLQRRELRSMDLEAPVSALALCADGKTLAVGTTNGVVSVYDLRGAITPLYCANACDGAVDATAVASLQFATPSSDTAGATVSPTGQPVISTQRTYGGTPSPTKQAHTDNTAAFSSPAQSMATHFFGDAHQQEGSTVYSSPTKSSASRHSSLTIITNHAHTGEAPPSLSNSAQSELAILQQHADQQRIASSQLNPLRPSTPTRVSESTSESTSRYEEPSLLSMLAEPSPTRARLQGPQTNGSPAPPPVPLTSPTSYTTTRAPSAFERNRDSLSAEISQFKTQLNNHNAEQEKHLTGLLQSVLAHYDALADENVQLRRENESLRAHLQQQHHKY